MMNLGTIILICAPVQVPDSAIIECATPTDMTGKDFMNPDDDKSRLMVEPQS